MIVRDKMGDIDRDNSNNGTVYAFKEKTNNNHYKELQIIIPKLYIENIGQLKRAYFYNVYENNNNGCLVTWGKSRSKSVNME